MVNESDIINKYLSLYYSEEEEKEDKYKEQLEQLEDIGETPIEYPEIEEPPVEQVVQPEQIQEDIIPDSDTNIVNKYLDLYYKQEETPFRAEILPQPEDSEVTVAQKTELGVRLEKTTLGNLWNLFKAGSLSLSNNKSLTDNIKLIEEERINKVYQDMQEKYGIDFRASENDAAVFAGRALVALGDPVTFFLPWAKFAKLGLLKNAAIGSGIASADMALYDYATNGEVNPNNVLFAAGLGGVSSAAGTVIANRVFGPKDKNINLGKLDGDENVVVQSTAKDNPVVTLNLKDSEALDDVAGKVATEYQALFKEMESTVHLNTMLTKAQADIKAYKDALKIIDKVADKSGQLELPILNKVKPISPQKLSALKKKRDEAIKFINDDLPEVIGKYARGQVDLLDATFKKLHERPQYEISQNVLRGVLDNFTRPFLGAGVGFSIGTFLNDDDEYGLTIALMGLGAGLGAAQKWMQKTPYLTKGMKEEGLSILKNNQMIALHNFLKVQSAGTLASKGIAHGGQNETLARMLFHIQDGKQRNIFSAEQATDAFNSYFSKEINKVVGNASLNQQRAAWRIVRELDTEQGVIKKFNLTDDDMLNVRTLVTNVNEFKKMFNNGYVRKAGVSFGEIENYGLPQFYNDKIFSDASGFKKAIRAAIKEEDSDIIAKFGKDKVKLKKYLDKRTDDIFNNMTGRGATKVFDENEKFTGIPLLKNFEKKRYFKKLSAVKKLEPYLEDNLHNVLIQWTRNTTKGVEFARKFGQRGELLKQLKYNLRSDYRAGKLSEAQYKSKRELLENTVNAYFGTHGGRVTDGHKTLMSILTFLSNTTMLPRAAIAQMGDFIQPLQNSSSGAAIRGIFSKFRKDRNFAEQAGIANKSSSTIEKDIEALYTAGVNPNTQVQLLLGNWTRKFFKLNLMAPLTDRGARFAYNVGVEDAFLMAKKNANKTKLGKATVEKLQFMSLDKNELKYLNKFDKVTDAWNDSTGRSLLSKAAFKVMNRDVLIPQVGNRMLFAQSQNPYIRSFGLFLSWAQAKTSQLNGLISRVEAGDVKLALKMMGAITIFGGLRELQIMASPAQKYYAENEPPNFSAKWWQEAAQLSGNVDWRIEKFARFFGGPSLRNPIENLSPAVAEASRILAAPAKVAANIGEGDYEGAVVQLFRPTPINEITARVLEDEPNREEKKKGLSQRAGFSIGGEVRKQYFEGQKVSKDYPVSDVEDIPADRINPYTGESYSGKTELEKQMEELI